MLTRRVPLKRGKPLRRGKGLRRQVGRAIGPPTAAQQAHQDRQRAHGCAACRVLGLTLACGPVRIHHRTRGDLHGAPQLGQDATVALGDWHHQGVLQARYPSVDAMLLTFGPSFHHHKRAFLALLADRLGARGLAALQAWQDAQLNQETR